MTDAAQPQLTFHCRTCLDCPQVIVQTVLAPDKPDELGTYRGLRCDACGNHAGPDQQDRIDALVDFAAQAAQFADPGSPTAGFERTVAFTGFPFEARLQLR